MYGFFEELRQDVRPGVSYPRPAGGGGDGGDEGERDEADYHISSYPSKRLEVPHYGSGLYRPPEEEAGGPCE